MRFHFGPGYRIYYARSGSEIYLLLIGGDKRKQQADIKKAKKLFREYSE
ncbi:addiction module killer-like protein [Bifidobacterium longum subsp. longum 2-2B]|nr:addiction module killer-like protein [Bifidobacterium longum subsp. longum 2-2B]